MKNPASTVTCLLLCVSWIGIVPLADAQAPTGTKTSNPSATKKAAAPKAANATGNPATPFTDNGDGTVTDNKTGAVWQKEDDGQEKKWVVSGGYCSSLKLGNHSDWRLPGMQDLVPLWENAGSKAEVRSTYFPSMKKDFYWSSSKGITFPGGLVTSYWGINFYGEGVQGQGADGNTGYVRCVRLGNNSKGPSK